jgi:hypothetical protein
MLFPCRLRAVATAAPTARYGRFVNSIGADWLWVVTMWSTGSRGTPMATESLTYTELGDRLGSSPDAARSLARRLRLLRKPGNDGKVRVIVDLAEIQYKPAPTRSPDGPQADNDAPNARIEQLQAELARLEMEKNCLEASVAAHRADFERERDRCDKLIAETLVLNKVAISARENAARLEGELSARRGRRRWVQFFAPRRANAQRPADTSMSASPLPTRI